MNLSRYLLVAAAAAVATACLDDESGELGLAPIEPSFAVRIINAVPDTGALDYRFVDEVENWPQATQLPYRSTSGNYLRFNSGNRRIRTFVNHLEPAFASQTLVDTTITFATDAFYTILHAGLSKAGQSPTDRFFVFQDNPPAPPAGQIGLHFIHGGTGTGNVDVYMYTGTAVPATPTFANVGPYTSTGYVNRPTGAYTVRVQAAGSAPGSAALATGTIPGGRAGTATANPEPGTTVAGSVMTAIFFGPGVSYRAAPTPPSTTTTTVTNGGPVSSLAFTFDRRPANTAN